MNLANFFYHGCARLGFDTRSRSVKKGTGGPSPSRWSPCRKKRG
jgi:hypothetical protein